MASLKELARIVNELDDQLVACMRCGLCQSVCPLYGETGRESDVARGKLALLDGLSKEMLDNPKEAKERLDRCLLCGSCEANCPSGVNVLDIFLKARAILTEYIGLSRFKKAIFRSMLARPALFDKLVSAGSFFQGIAAKPVNPELGTSCARIEFPLGPRHVPRLASTPFHKTAKDLPKPAKPSGPRVALYTGCLIDKVFPRVGTAVVKALTHHNLATVIPNNQACCGIPSLASGDTTAFKKMLVHNLDLFEKEQFDYLVTACATCTSTIKKVWPSAAKDFGPSIQGRAGALAGKTLDIGQFLDDMNLIEPAVAGDANLPRVTYHDPCHLKKSLGVSQAPRNALTAGGSYQLVEMTEPDWCCGMGGSFNLQHYDLSRTIGQRKIDNIVASGCDVVATGCPACMVQIMDGLSRGGHRIKIRHFMEIYADGLDVPSGPRKPSD